MHEAPASYCAILECYISFDIYKMVDAPAWERVAPASRVLTVRILYSVKFLQNRWTPYIRISHLTPQYLGG